MRVLFPLAYATLLTLCLAASVFAQSLPDTDGDGVVDLVDNCEAVANGPLAGACSSQEDANANGYGNACEADWDQDGIVGSSDFLIFSASFGSVPGDPHWAPHVDSDCDGTIGGSDFLLFSSQFGDPPGPSGLACADPNASDCTAESVSVLRSIYRDPGTGPWEIVAEADLISTCGLDPQILASIDAVTSFPYIIIRHGRLCHEFYPNGGPGPGFESHNFSVTKTLSAAVLGRMVKISQDLPNPLQDTDAVDRWIDPANYPDDPLVPDALVAHVLAEVAQPNADSSNGLSYGERLWLYDDIGTRQNGRLGDVMEAVMTDTENAPFFQAFTQLQDFVDVEMLNKLGMENTRFAATIPGAEFLGEFPLNNYVVAFGWFSGVRDMGRLGLMLGHDGVWNGERILDPTWVDKMSHATFEDSNTGYGYLTYTASDYGFKVPGISSFFFNPFSSCQPPAIWPEYPHGLSESLDCEYGGPYTCDQRLDVGVFGAAGYGGDVIVIHPGLDLVLAAQNAGDGFFLQGLWNRIRPALVAHDPVYPGNEAAFCSAYRSGEYAPDWINPF